MNFDQIPKPEAISSFSKKEFTKDGTVYLFDHVAVKIDTSGKNSKELPELLFGTFDDEPNPSSLHQPGSKREDIDMAYVARCVKEAMRDSDVHELWFSPSGEDVPPEQKESRQQARLRLFQKMGDIAPAPNGFGYILRI